MAWLHLKGAWWDGSVRVASKRKPGYSPWVLNRTVRDAPAPMLPCR